MWRDRLVELLERRPRCLALVGYALLTAAMTWPVVARLTTHVPGGTVDLWTHRWTFWWIKHALTEGHNPFHTDLLFHPQGVSLAFHNIAWVNIVVWLPLQWVVGGDAAYALTFLIFCTLNGFATYLLVRELVASELAAFVGGIVFGFWPYTMSQFGHPNMQVTCWVPLALLFLRRTVEGGRVRDALLSGLFLALTGLTRWQLLAMASLLFLLYVAWRLLRDRESWNLRSVGLLALAVAVAAALMAPLAVPVASALLARDDPTDVLFTEEVTAQTDLLAYVLPTPYHPLWSDRLEGLHENLAHNRVYVPFLGYATLVVALYGAIRSWRRARFWLLVAGIYVLLALGPQLRVNGQLYPAIPMPYRLLGDCSLVRAIRVPNRFNLFLGLPMAVLVSLGAAALTRHRSRLVSLLFVVGLVALVLLEYNLVPYHTERPETPDWYRRLAHEPGRAAVLDLPIGLHTYNKQYMFYQITHQKPLVEGKIARPPREAFAFIERSPFLSQLHTGNVMDPDLVNVSGQLRVLANAGVGYIVLHKEFATSNQLLDWRDWLTFSPMHEDDALVVYRTDPQWNRDFGFAHSLTEELGLIRASVSSTETIPGAVISVDARWGSAGTPNADYQVCLNLVRSTGSPRQAQCVPLAEEWPPSRWESGEVVRSSYVLQLPLSVQPGDYGLLLTLSGDAADGPIGQPADLGRLRVAPLDPEHPVKATLGRRVELRGYDLRRSSRELSLTLYWRALSEMDTSYKVFVHLTDLSSGDILTQADVVPRGWEHPTDSWLKGEVVRDTVSLSLEGVTPGEYPLTVGLYDPATGRRLEARDRDRARYPADAVSIGLVRVD